MYHSSFGLSEPPFSIAVDPRYLYMSDRHRDALAHLVYGVGVGGGFILLTGEVGTGKTTIIRCLLAQLPETTDLALVLNPALDARQLLATVCDELAISTDTDDLKSLTDHLHRFLLANHQRGRNTVLLIDEAQHLDADVLEQIRLLTNLETNTRKLLQIVLVGQPELKAKLAQPELRQLSQRITARFELQALDARETSAYIEHRLQVGGLAGRQRLFSPRIMARIHRASGGIPRLINIICDRALLGGYARRHSRVDRHTLRQAIGEVSGVAARSLSPHERLEQVYPWLLAGLSLATVGILLWSEALRWSVPWRADPASPAVAATVAAIAPVVPPGFAPALPASTTARATTARATTAIPTTAMPTTALAAEPPSVPPAVSVADQAALPADAWEGLAAWSFEEDSIALGVLLAQLGHIAAPVAAPCITLSERGLRCELLQLDGWADLASHQAPALLELRAGAALRWVIVLEVAATEALVLGGGAEQRLGEAMLSGHWTGRVLIPWVAPPGYRYALRRGSSGQTVSWLARGFARLDGREQALADSEYNALLEQRVRLFQREQALFVDGVAGFRTLLRLQQALSEHSDDGASVAMLGKGD